MSATVRAPETCGIAYRNADTLTGLRTAAEFPSLNLYATRYGLTFGPLFAPFAGCSLGTIGRPKKSTATYNTHAMHRVSDSWHGSEKLRKHKSDTDLLSRLVVVARPLRCGLWVVC